MKNEKIEALLETLKEYRNHDLSFMKIYREYKIDSTIEGSKEEVLNALIEWLDESDFIRPYHEDEVMDESANTTTYSGISSGISISTGI